MAPFPVFLGNEVQLVMEKKKGSGNNDAAGDNRNIGADTFQFESTWNDSVIS